MGGKLLSLVLALAVSYLLGVVTRQPAQTSCPHAVAREPVDAPASGIPFVPHEHDISIILLKASPGRAIWVFLVKAVPYRCLALNLHINVSRNIDRCGWVDILHVGQQAE